MKNIILLPILGGGIDGKCYTNSLEAWEKSYEGGIRVFDADLCFTSDRRLVLRHEWYDDFEQENITEENVPSFTEFMDEAIFYKYTPMSVEMMIEFMQKYQDCFVICDCKDEDTEILINFIELIQEMKCEKILDRIIISFYDFKEYEEIKNIFNFPNLVIRQYVNNQHNYYELAEFCLQNQIRVCMVGAYFLEEGDDISILTEQGITVYAAVVNSLQKFKTYKELGVNGCVSDYILEDDMVYIQ